MNKTIKDKTVVLFIKMTNSTTQMKKKSFLFEWAIFEWDIYQVIPSFFISYRNFSIFRLWYLWFIILTEYFSTFLWNVSEYHKKKD